jgi:hypothetical protein
MTPTSKSHTRSPVANPAFGTTDIVARPRQTTADGGDMAQRPGASHHRRGGPANDAAFVGPEAGSR